MKRVAMLLAFSVWAMAANAPALFFSKQFPGSKPPYMQIAVDRSGDAVYGEDPNDDQPLKFKLSQAEVDELFGLAEKLDNFKRPLESGLKVANMGMKTFRYENGAEKTEQKFNYATDENARLLLDCFERMVETEQHFINLERTIRFDRIGVNQALLDLSVSYERKRLVAPDQFLPLLDRIVKNDAFVHIARERAASLADAFRASKPKAE